MKLKDLMSTIAETDTIILHFDFGTVRGACTDLDVSLHDFLFESEVTCVQAKCDELDTDILEIWAKEEVPESKNDRKEDTCMPKPEKPMSFEELEAYYEEFAVRHDCISAHIFVEDAENHCFYAAILDRDLSGFMATWNGCADDNYIESTYGAEWRAWRRRPSEEELKAAGSF